MSDVDVAVRELRQILDGHRTSPEWRWNARLRLAAARAALGAVPAAAGPVPAQPTGAHDEAHAALSERLDALASGVMDDLDVATIEREVGAVLRDLEPYAER